MRQRLLMRLCAVPCVLGILAALVPDVSALLGTRQTPATVFGGDGEISGVVFLDADSSRTADAGENGVAGMSVVLMTRWGGFPLAVAETPADGRFRFERVVTGAYRLTLQTPPGTTPTGDVSRIVEVTDANRAVRYDFGITTESGR
jgi:hypothetical protein